MFAGSTSPYLSQYGVLTRPKGYYMKMSHHEITIFRQSLHSFLDYLAELCEPQWVTNALFLNPSQANCRRRFTTKWLVWRIICMQKKTLKHHDVVEFFCIQIILQSGNFVVKCRLQFVWEVKHPDLIKKKLFCNSISKSRIFRYCFAYRKVVFSAVF